MTKKELIEMLENANDYADVLFYDTTKEEFYMIDIAYFDGEKVILEEKEI